MLRTGWHLSQYGGGNCTFRGEALYIFITQRLGEIMCIIFILYNKHTEHLSGKFIFLFIAQRLGEIIYQRKLMKLRCVLVKRDTLVTWCLG